MNFLILDRDGVINEDSPSYICSADKWKQYASLAGVAEALTHEG